MKIIKYILVIYLVTCMFNISIQAQVINHNFNTPLNDLPCNLYIINNSIYFAYQIVNSPDDYQTLSFKMIKANLQGEVTDSFEIAGIPGYYNDVRVLLFNNNFYRFTVMQGDSVTLSKYTVLKIDTNLQITVNKEYSGVLHYLHEFDPVIINHKILLFNRGNLDNYYFVGDTTQMVLFNENCDTIKTDLKLPWMPFRGSQFWPNDILYIPNETNFYCFEGHEVQKFDTCFSPLWSNDRVVCYPNLTFEIVNQSSVFWKDDSTFTIISNIDYMPPDSTYTWSPVSIINIDTSLSIQSDYPAPIILGVNDNFKRFFPFKSIKLLNGDYIVTYYFMEDLPPGDMFDWAANKIYVKRYTSDLNLVWSKVISGGDSTFFPQETVDMGDGFLIYGCKFDHLGSSPNYDIFFYKFDYDGNYYKIMELPGGKVWAKAFPNPGQDYFDLECSNIFTGADLLLYDVSGQQVLQQKIKDSEQKIFTGNLLPGSYVYSIQQGGIKVYSGKWEKQK